MMSLSLVSLTIEKLILLPGVPPTGRYTELPHVVIMNFKDGKISHEHIYWDQASLLVQIGLLGPKLLPVTGQEQAKRLVELSQKASYSVFKKDMRIQFVMGDLANAALVNETLYESGYPTLIF
jgi:hypothetical protein